MSLDHFAIYKAYAGVVRRICDDENAAYDIDGKKIELDQNKINAARATLDSEFAATKYQRDRAAAYPDWGTQLDYIYHNGLDKWKTDIVDPVKSKYPKPS
tara:strand:- start:643 stop:942 length:300 start_codon:yes stop_codon:yes gene_type:complete